MRNILIASIFCFILAFLFFLCSDFIFNPTNQSREIIKIIFLVLVCLNFIAVVVLSFKGKLQLYLNKMDIFLCAFLDYGIYIAYTQLLKENPSRFLFYFSIVFSIYLLAVIYYLGLVANKDSQKSILVLIPKLFFSGCILGNALVVLSFLNGLIQTSSSFSIAEGFQAFASLIGFLLMTYGACKLIKPLRIKKN